MPTPAQADRAWPGYAAVWRWHFYAGLFCIPFVLWLALTGSVYLFRPQVEAWLDAPYANVAAEAGPRASAARQVDAALKAVPSATFQRYQLPDTATQAVQIIVGQGARRNRVYVNPQTLAVLKVADEDRRPMEVVLRLHGELLAGDPGSYLVELAASWAIVMILSGLFLWWPRGRGPAGVVWPRLQAGGRPFWRDLHAVTGFWVSLMALFLLLSGLPWAKSWGSYFQMVRTAVEGPVNQDWTVDHGAARNADHAEHRGMSVTGAGGSYAALDRLVPVVGSLEFAAPVLIAPPNAPGQPWTAKSNAADRPRRAEATLDGTTGDVLTRTNFAQRRLADRLVGYGIAIHEGALFGWLNQLLNLVTAIGLVLLAVSGAVMWWRRRPAGSLGSPPVRTGPRAAVGFFGVVTALGVVLPLFGGSLLLVLLLDRVRGRLRYI